jgi:hypothetical protein
MTTTTTSELVRPTLDEYKARMRQLEAEQQATRKAKKVSIQLPADVQRRLADLLPMNARERFMVKAICDALAAEEGPMLFDLPEEERS